jgi:hypothetical protein
LISYFAIIKSENVRWKHDKQEKLVEQQRNAIVQALDLVDVLKDAIYKSIIVSDAAFYGSESARFIDERWPDIFQELSLGDFPGYLSVLLVPTDTIKRIRDIAILIVEMKRELINYWGKSQQIRIKISPPRPYTPSTWRGIWQVGIIISSSSAFFTGAF